MCVRERERERERERKKGGGGKNRRWTWMMYSNDDLSYYTTSSVSLNKLQKPRCISQLLTGQTSGAFPCTCRLSSTPSDSALRPNTVGICISITAGCMLRPKVCLVTDDALVQSNMSDR